MAAYLEWVGVDWFAKIVEFRRQPSIYLGRKGVNEESFLHDILQALCSEELPDSVKVHLLSLLGEHGQLFFQKPHSVEQTVASLEDIFHQTDQSSAQFFSAQILVTICSVLIEFNHLGTDRQQCERQVDLILEIVSKINTSQTRLLRGTACECLEELERSYPGLLVSKLEHFYQMSQLEKTCINQNYLTLFTTVLNHAVQKTLAHHEGQSKSSLTEMLCHRSETLCPFKIPYDVQSFKVSSAISTPVDTSGMSDDLELRKALTYIIENIQLLTPDGAFYTMGLLSDIVTSLSHGKFSPVIFKTWALRHINTENVGLFHMVFLLYIKFGSRLLGPLEHEALLQQLVNILNLPGLSSAHRLLFFNWLLHYPNDSQEELSIASVPESLDYTHYKAFFPCVFDGADTQLKKLEVLQLCFVPGEHEDSASATLMGCLIGLQKFVEYGIVGKSSTALFKILSLYYQNHRMSILPRDIQKLLASIVVCHPKFVPNVIDLLTFTDEIDTTCCFSSDVLSTLLENTFNIDMPTALANLTYHLELLERCASQPAIKPMATLQFILKLVMRTSLCQEGDWAVGNKVLSVIRALMQFHDTDNLFIGLGDLLHHLFNHHVDVDIRDRAKFYYSLLITLSSNKISNVLTKSENRTSGNSNNLTSLVAGSASFPSASPIIHLDKPSIHLKLRRLENHQQNAEDLLKIRKLLPPISSLQDYLKYMNTYPELTTRKAIFKVYMDKECEFDQVHTLLIRFSTDEFYSPINDVCIPCLAKNHLSSAIPDFKDIVVEIKALDPRPTTILPNVTFTAVKNNTYNCQMDAIDLSFEDMFLPLCVPKGLTLTLTAQPLGLFEELWQAITSKENRKQSCVESMYAMALGGNEAEMCIEASLGQHIVSHHKSDSKSLYKIAILLPPLHHLLMQINISMETAIVSIATDYWKILPLVNSYLSQLDLKFENSRLLST